MLTVWQHRKPEKYFYLETTNKDETKNALKKWLQCRIVGLPTAWNRLLNFHTFRSTKAIVYTAPLFVQESGNLSLRFAEHLAAQPDYPEPMHYSTFNGKYFFRSALLRHLRLAQFNCYCIILDKASAGTTNLTSENTIDEDDSANPYRVLDAGHRNYDPTTEGTAASSLPSRRLAAHLVVTTKRMAISRKHLCITGRRLLKPIH